MGNRRAAVESAVNRDVATLGAPRRRRALGRVLAVLLALSPVRFAAAGDTIFSNGFETGYSCAWSLTAPVPATCTDAILDDCETDVDCGGGQCALCADFQLCAVHTDCQSGLCEGNVCVQCVAASTCPGLDTECQTRTCQSGACGFLYTELGFVTSEQSAGDCQVAVCDGTGGIAALADDGDLPDDGLECTDDLCTAGTPSFFPSPLGMPCSDGGGNVCDGTGVCVECVEASDCPGSDTECEARTCDANVCGFSFAPFGEACTGGTCDGAGTCVPDTP